MVTVSRAEAGRMSSSTVLVAATCCQVAAGPRPLPQMAQFVGGPEKWAKSVKAPLTFMADVAVLGNPILERFCPSLLETLLPLRFQRSHAGFDVAGTCRRRASQFQPSSKVLCAIVDLRFYRALILRPRKAIQQCSKAISGHATGEATVRAYSYKRHELPQHGPRRMEHPIHPMNGKFFCLSAAGHRVAKLSGQRMAAVPPVPGYRSASRPAIHTRITPSFRNNLLKNLADVEQDRCRIFRAAAYTDIGGELCINKNRGSDE